MTKAHFEVQNLTKSCNEALILAILAERPRHGYQLALELEERSNGFFRFNHGTLYPILHKLENDGLIRGTWSDEGPRRNSIRSIWPGAIRFQSTWSRSKSLSGISSTRTRAWPCR